MTPIVAVEGDMANVFQTLENSRYSPISLAKADLDSVDAVVISGGDENVTGVMKTITNAPVIDAGGLSAQEIKDKLDSTFKKNIR
ncbi:MAG: YkuS family protein [Halanaerobiaceae bacterium]